MAKRNYYFKGKKTTNYMTTAKNKQMIQHSVIVRINLINVIELEKSQFRE